MSCFPNSRLGSLSRMWGGSRSRETGRDGAGHHTHASCPSHSNLSPAPIAKGMVTPPRSCHRWNAVGSLWNIP